MAISGDICTLDQLRDILPKGRGSGDEKVVSRIDEHCRRFIEHSPFLIVASRNAAGRMDVSPKGDPAGFVRILDEQTIAIPERPGNHRCDTFTNILEVPDVALIFLVPGEDLTLRVMGQASLTSAPEVLEPMAMNGRAPKVALLVAVEEAFIHCGKAPKRAHLWDPATHVDKGVFPRMGEMLHDQIAENVGTPDFGLTKSELGDITDDDYANKVY